ncbi:MAG: o-succinylbenzoate synthase [Propionibacteriaceae bacterium]|nr:o-succinylbenzoate synthase [Propionibacteriaceae bacterium]
MIVYDTALRLRFRGISRRQGVLFRGPAGWAEWSPFLDYGGPELVPWWLAAREAAVEGFPAPLRDEVWVNATIPAVGPDLAYARAKESGCRTAKVKVAEPGQAFAADEARVEAVRAALGPSGRIRVDANGAWTPEEALRRLRVLSRYGIEYAEQPCRSTEELAGLRRALLRAGVSVPIAADESIRRSDDPARVKRLAAADVAVLKVQPLGGVRACLRWAEELAIPVVVSSALETSIGISAGLALAAALPELPYDCGLNTVNLLASDVVEEPLVAVGGRLRLTRPAVAPDRVPRADEATAAAWQARLNETKELACPPG